MTASTPAGRSAAVTACVDGPTDPPTVGGWYQLTPETTMATMRTSARATSA